MEKQNKITKREDGHYYERIVTWEKEPEYCKILFAIMGTIFGSAPWWVSFWRSDLNFFLGGMLIIIFIKGIFQGLGEGRQVKFRRIK